jgi:hypothetical protein
MDLHRLIPLIPALFLVACDPPKGNLGEYTGGDTSGDTSDSETSDSETGYTNDDLFDPHCEEPATPSKEQALIDFDPPLPFDDGNFAGTCTVASNTGLGVGLDCDGTTVMIQLQLDDLAPPLPPIDGQVVLDYRSVMAFGIDQWFTLRDLDDELLLAGVAAPELEPPDALGFFAPLGASKLDAVCQTPVTCDNMSQKLAVNVTYGDDAIQVFSQHASVIGEFRVSVAHARRHYQEVQEGDQICSVYDIPERWFSVLIRRVGE